MGEVRVGTKSAGEYAAAVKFALDKFNRPVIVRGLGKNAIKVYNIAHLLRNHTDFRVSEPQSFRVGGTDGLEITIRKREEDG